MQSYGFLTEKKSLFQPCCSVDYEKHVIFFLPEHKPNLFPGNVMDFFLCASGTEEEIRTEKVLVVKSWTIISENIFIRNPQCV